MKKKIVVADDEFAQCALLVQMFTKAGFEVLATMKADELREFARVDGVVAVVTDDGLIRGGSGLEALREIHRDSTLAHVRLVLISASQLDMEASEIGALFFEKPFNPFDLRDALTRDP